MMSLTTLYVSVSLLLGVLAIPFTYLFSWNKDALSKPGEARDRRIDWARNRTFGTIYRDNLLQPALRLYDMYVCKDARGSDDPAEAVHPLQFFTLGSLEFCIRYAFIIPPLVLTMLWMFAAPPTVIGHRLFPQPSDVWHNPPSTAFFLLRLMAAGSIIIFIQNSYFLLPSKATVPFKIILNLGQIAPLFVLALFAGLGSVAPLIVAFGLAYRHPAATIQNLSLLGALSAIVTFYSAGDYATMALVIVFLVRIWYGAFYEHLPGIPMPYRRWRHIYFVQIIVSTYFFALPVPRSQAAQNIAFSGYIYSILPILYSHLVWTAFSIGRGLLELTRRERISGLRSFLFAFISVILAIFLAALYSVIVTITSGLITRLSRIGHNQPFLDLEPIFQGISVHPLAEEYWWIYLIFVFIIIPLVFYCALAGAALIMWFPQSLIGWAVTGWDKPNNEIDIDRLTLLSAYLTISPFLGLIGSVVTLSLSMLCIYNVFMWQAAATPSTFIRILQYMYAISAGG